MKPILIILFLLTRLASAEEPRAFDTEFRLKYLSRFAAHTREPQDLASHRHTLEMEQQGWWKRFTAVASLRAFTEAAFSTNTNRYAGVPSAENHDVSVRDLYLQYKQGPWTVRVGNQQVVWGEAFGFYYADLVNPKDLREFALGDQTAQRLPVPMLFTKWVGESTSVEALLIAKPFFNLNAAPATDFASPIYRALGGFNLNIIDDRSPELNAANVEGGVRVTRNFSKVDLSAFAFYAYDRFATYEASFSAPSTFTLRAQHPRLLTVGLTNSYDLSPVILRSELLYHRERSFDSFQSGVFSTRRSDEIIAVIGGDYTFKEWRIGAQLAENFLLTPVPGSISDRYSGLLALHANGPAWLDHLVEAVLSYSYRDGSALGQVFYNVPVSKQVELGFGGDFLFGGENSQFGQFKSGSRGYLRLKAFLTS